MLAALPHLLGFFLPGAAVFRVRLGGAWTFLPAGLLLIAVPILDALSGLDRSTPSEDADLSRNPWFRVVTWSWAVVQPLLLLWTLDCVASDTLSPLELCGLTLSVGMTTGTIGLTFAHELVHRASRLSTWMLINLARHADHNMLASKRYQVLDPLDAAPQLPAGYGSMFLLALVPPLWRRTMDPRVIAWRIQHASSPEGT